MRSDDTIFATASGSRPRGRLPDPDQRPGEPHSSSKRSRARCRLPAAPPFALLRDPRTGEPLDQALVAWMPGPASFTGEDQAELHIHGGLATRAAVLRALERPARIAAPAEAGEFTRRAFLNGRMDLSRVEGLADLIDAETEAQRRQALLPARRAPRQRRRRLARGRAPGVGDAGGKPRFLRRGRCAGRTWRPISCGDLTRFSRRDRREPIANRSGERLREGLMVVLAGAPNAGKSTLLNALARRDVAIVSPIAGTTRDVIEVRCDLGGLPVIDRRHGGFASRATISSSARVWRGREARAQDADLVLWLVAPDDSEAPAPPGRRLLRIGTKADLNRHRDDCDLVVSATNGDGIPGAARRVEEEAAALLGTGADAIADPRTPSCGSGGRSPFINQRDRNAPPCRARRVRRRRSAVGCAGLGPDHRAGRRGGCSGPAVLQFLHRQMRSPLMN